VATAFPHAVELLSSGAGIVVPHRDATALGAALRRVLTEPGRVESMASEAARLAPAFGWPAVARQYGDLADDLLADGPTHNQGAEPTLSLTSTSQYGCRPVGVAP
jgi:glycosyltransferase involved in cell wall biosynthesis